MTINRLGLCAGLSCNPSQTLAGSPNPNPNPRTRFVMIRVFKAHRQAFASLYSFTLPEQGFWGAASRCCRHGAASSHVQELKPEQGDGGLGRREDQAQSLRRVRFALGHASLPSSRCVHRVMLHPAGSSPRWDRFSRFSFTCNTRTIEHPKVH